VIAFSDMLELYLCLSVPPYVSELGRWFTSQILIQQSFLCFSKPSASWDINKHGQNYIKVTLSFPIDLFLKQIILRN